MDTPNTQIAINEKRITMLEKWQDSCQWMPQMLYELTQWKKDQNGDIREIRDSIKELQDDVRDLTIEGGRRRRRMVHKDRVLKWVLGGIAFGSFLTAILTNIF